MFQTKVQWCNERCKLVLIKFWKEFLKKYLNEKKTFFKILFTQVCSAYYAIKLLLETYFSVSCTLGVIRENVEVPIWFWG